MNGRIFDPVLGRMLSVDPIIPGLGDLQAYNRYTYVLNNPLRFDDPTGEGPREKTAGAIEGPAHAVIETRTGLVMTGLAEEDFACHIGLAFHSPDSPAGKMLTASLDMSQRVADRVQQQEVDDKTAVSDFATRTTGAVADVNVSDRSAVRTGTKIATKFVLAALSFIGGGSSQRRQVLNLDKMG